MQITKMFNYTTSYEITIQPFNQPLKYLTTSAYEDV